MLAMQAKQGIESACQKVFQSSGKRFDSFKMIWHGDTAKVNYDEHGNAIIVMPSIDETKEVSKKLFNDLIGYVLHELGHVWFTTNQPWDDAVKEHGKFMGHLINALEDPRIEHKVIVSGYAPNSADLFNSLINNVIEKNGYPDALTKQSLPFIMCVEGRRLNGYNIDVPDLISSSLFASDIRLALSTAHVATSTKHIVKIAIELHKKLFEGSDDDGEEPVETNPEGKGKGKGDDGDGDGEKGGTLSDKPSGGGEHIPDSGKEARDPEINDYISDESKPLKCSADKRIYRPVLNSVQDVKFIFT